MDVATVLAKRQRVIDVVAEIGLACELHVSERSSLNDALSSYEPSMPLHKLDGLDELIGCIIRESALMLTIRGEIMTRHQRAHWNCSAFDVIDAYTDLLNTIERSARDKFTHDSMLP